MRSLILVGLVAIGACGPATSRPGEGDDDAGGSGSGSGCAQTCSDDLQSIVDCNGNVVTQCTDGAGCDPTQLACVDACQAADANRRSVGCNYYATDMDVSQQEYCFAAFVANTWSTPAKLSVTYMGQPLNTAAFTRIPSGSGPTLTYAPYDANAGIPPGEVAVVFLAGSQGSAPNCPVTPAVASSGASGSRIGNSFELTTDVPVVAYQINPYGGGSVAVTAGSLLLPTSVWDTEYVAVNVSARGIAGDPSLNIVARTDNTQVTLTPNVAVAGGGGIPSGAAGTPVMITLNKGQHAQITQTAELTGSAISANNPIGFMAGQVCMNVPTNTAYCDHGEQMVPPVRALGSRYVGVMYRPRVAAETGTIWRLVGAVDGTQLTWSSPVGGPTTLNRGQVVEFETGTPFEVSSQSADHPFALFTYMTGSTRNGDGYGDPDFVVSVPPEQYLRSYVFFTDPTYPETNLVMIRKRAADSSFKDVTLDCLGTVTGWQPITGTADYEFTRVDLSTGDFAAVGGCSTGRHEVSSPGQFGLWVWGWGTPLTSIFTANVSYGYPGGMNVEPINDVILRTQQ